LRKSQQHPNGGRLEIEAPISISNVLVVTEGGDAIPVRKASRNSDGKVVVKTAEASEK
jgi:ribosomal protein L24